MDLCWRQQKLKNKQSKTRSFIKTALTFDLKEIFQLYFDILKDK